MLLKRAWLNISRDPRAVKAAMGQAIIMGLIVGFLFFQLGTNQVADCCEDVLLCHLRGLPFASLYPFQPPVSLSLSI